MRYETIRSTQKPHVYTKRSLGITWFFDIQSSPGHRALGNLFRFSQTDGVVTDVVDTVPAAQEGITQNSKGTHRLWEVHAHEAADAGALDLQDVVVGANGELVTTQGEGEVRQRVTLVTLDTVLTSEALGGTNLLVPVGWVSKYVTKTRGKSTYSSSAMVEGRAMREVPVSRMTPVFSSSATLLPRAMELSSTSQYALRRRGILISSPV